MIRWICALWRALRGPRQPALGCLSNEELDRILAQEDPGREGQN